jgi:hypothetical protein
MIRRLQGIECINGILCHNDLSIVLVLGSVDLRIILTLYDRPVDDAMVRMEAGATPTSLMESGADCGSLGHASTRRIEMQWTACDPGPGLRGLNV